MAQDVKSVVRAITPPIILSAAKALVTSVQKRDTLREESGEKEADWYDSSFDRNAHWKYHYTKSHYYFLWVLIVDRILRSGVNSILEIGCGSGQLACLLRDRGINNYHGFDFSPKRLAQAKSVCPEFSFTEEDAFETQLFKTYDYDTVLSTEFLEHVEGDIEVIRRIRSGTKFFGTVPNFPSASHVRHFENTSEVIARYTNCFVDLKVDAILATDQGKSFFLLEGTIS